MLHSGWKWYIASVNSLQYYTHGKIVCNGAKYGVKDKSDTILSKDFAPIHRMYVQIFCIATYSVICSILYMCMYVMYVCMLGVLNIVTFNM